jgi:hypothetical protein
MARDQQITTAKMEEVASPRLFYKVGSNVMSRLKVTGLLSDRPFLLVITNALPRNYHSRGFN